MGSPTLKAKIAHDYKKQRASSETICRTCNAFVPDFEVRAIGGAVLGHEPRCAMFGLNHGRSYRVRGDHGCDAHDNSEYLAQCEELAKKGFGGKR